jgi:hypothetical protein
MLPASKKQQREQTLSKSREEEHKNPKKMSGRDNAYLKPRTSRFRAAKVVLPYAPPPPLSLPQCILRKYWIPFKDSVTPC